MVVANGVRTKLLFHLKGLGILAICLNLNSHMNYTSSFCKRLQNVIMK